MSIVTAKTWNVRPTLEAEQLATKNRLEKLNGTAFDRAYVEAMEKDHQKDIAVFEKEAKRAFTTTSQW